MTQLLKIHAVSNVHWKHVVDWRQKLYSNEKNTHSFFRLLYDLFNASINQSIKTHL